MPGRKTRNVWEYGDFQTPPELADKVCGVLVRRDIVPDAIVEPTCGRGAFLAAAGKHFAGIRRLLGFEINEDHANEARALAGDDAQVEIRDFFGVDWNAVLSRDPGSWLVLGNPPWVTNADLGLLNSTNLPPKSNFQGHDGLDALTGKANFDISEWMLLDQIEWLRKRKGWIAMLVKTSVARKCLRQAWRRGDPVGRASIHRIDAKRYFDAAVEACLFVLPVSIGERSQDCDVFANLGATSPESTIGFHDGILVSDVRSYKKHRDLIGSNETHVWRSGVKHDCSRIMELREKSDGILTNGLGENVDIEPDILFPLLKSSDVSRGRTQTGRYMIVTQRKIGQDTAGLSVASPKTWRYLVRHADKLDARGSIIYKGKPRFSIFGVGNYTFAPWKVAVSGFYKTPNFIKAGPVNGKPVVMDDTVYFLPCESEEEADFVLSLVQSQPFSEFLDAMIFNDEKRTVTADILKRISLGSLAKKNGLAGEYAMFADRSRPAQIRLAS